MCNYISRLSIQRIGRIESSKYEMLCDGETSEIVLNQFKMYAHNRRTRYSKHNNQYLATQTRALRRLKTATLYARTWGKSRDFYETFCEMSLRKMMRIFIVTLAMR